MVKPGSKAESIGASVEMRGACASMYVRPPWIRRKLESDQMDPRLGIMTGWPPEPRPTWRAMRGVNSNGQTLDARKFV